MACHRSPLHHITTSDSSLSSTALIVLNNGPSLRELKQFLIDTWDTFTVHVCADGGTNSLYDSVTSEEDRLKYIPDVIIGDFDSVREQVLTYYKSKGSVIIHDTDQNSTDFNKALTYLSVKYTQCRIVYVFNCMWGRLDQVLGNLHELYLTELPEVYIVTEDSIVMLLQPGEHSIQLKRELVEGHCGLIPYGETCQECWTSGLKWNLDGQTLTMSGLISTCNLFESKPHLLSDYIVTIKCSHKLLFTLSHKLFNK